MAEPGTILVELLANAIDWQVVSGLRNRYLTRDFVETGTCDGRTAQFASLIFDRVWTIEVDPAKHHDASVGLLQGVGNVQQVLGDSAVVLPKILDEIGDRPTMLYIDAHWCGGERCTKTECPIVAEMLALRPRFEAGINDVVIVDNASMFLTKPLPPHRADDWPHISEVVAALRPLGAIRPFIQLVGDQLYITQQPFLEVF